MYFKTGRTYSQVEYFVEHVYIQWGEIFNMIFGNTSGGHFFYSEINIFLMSLKVCFLKRAQCILRVQRTIHTFLCFVVIVPVSFTLIFQGNFAGLIGAVILLPKCQRSKPTKYGQINHLKWNYDVMKTKQNTQKMCIFHRIYCVSQPSWININPSMDK